MHYNMVAWDTLTREQKLEFVDRFLADADKVVLKNYNWFSSVVDLLWTPEVGEAIGLAIRKRLIGSVTSEYLSYANNNDLEGSRKVGDLYVMASTRMEAVKIGRSTNSATTRASQLKTGCPDIRAVAVFVGFGEYEHSVHQELDWASVGGERFRLKPSDAVNLISAKLGVTPVLV